MAKMTPLEEVEKMVLDAAAEAKESGETSESLSNGLAGLNIKKPKKTYKTLRIEPDVANKFIAASKALKVTQTDLLEYMVQKLHDEAQAEKDARASK